MAGTSQNLSNDSQENGPPSAEISRDAWSVHLRQLRYFLVVAEELHFGRAADRLNLTQPALSDAIRRLEASIGARLLDRGSRHVSLTLAGEDFLPRARQILVDVEAATAAARRIDVGEVGPLRIGYTPVSRAAYESLASSFSAEHRDITISAREMYTVDLLDDVRDRRIDVAITFMGRRVNGLSFRPIRSLELVALVASSSRFAGREEVAISELRDETLLLTERNLAPEYIDHLIQLCQEAGFDPEIGPLRQPFDGEWPQIAAGEGYVIGPAEYFAGLAASGVTIVPLTEELRLPLELTWRTGEANQAASRFIEFALLDSGARSAH